MDESALLTRVSIFSFNCSASFCAVLIPFFICFEISSSKPPTLVAMFLKRENLSDRNKCLTNAAGIVCSIQVNEIGMLSFGDSLSNLSKMEKSKKSGCLVSLTVQKLYSYINLSILNKKKCLSLFNSDKLGRLPPSIFS